MFFSVPCPQYLFSPQHKGQEDMCKGRRWEQRCPQLRVCGVQGLHLNSVRASWQAGGLKVAYQVELRSASFPSSYKL